MFQTFSGSSRRPRQVNLSGQNSNPFAAGSWTPTASGTQKTVANAQQERLQRQQDRERLNASKRIQRTWRGHKVRRELADTRRQYWDEESRGQRQPKSNASDLKLFLAFFNPRREDDRHRLEILSQGILHEGQDIFMAQHDVQAQLPRLARLILAALRLSHTECPNDLLTLLINILQARPDITSQLSESYYEVLSTMLVENLLSWNTNPTTVISAIVTPLSPGARDGDNDQPLLANHASFAWHILTIPNLESLVGGSLAALGAGVNFSILSTTLALEFTKASVLKIISERRLWLLAHFIALHRLQSRTDHESEYLRALSLQISSSTRDLVGRLDDSDLTTMDQEVEKNSVTPIPDLVKKELTSLVNEESVSGLLAKYGGYSKEKSSAVEEDASLLASYALTLLRIFPRRSDEIRMWLYRGSMRTNSGRSMPALKFFWQAMASTKTFSIIQGDTQSALGLLKMQTLQFQNVSSTTEGLQDREWRAVLLFLELYTFVLRFTDDEEFLSGSSDFGSVPNSISSFRDSALPLQDVKSLTVFLKNLAFAAYFNAGQLSDEQQSLEGGLGSYFGTMSTPQNFSHHNSDVERSQRGSKRPFAGVAGMTIEYVRTIVTAVMRMLYERDSRRRFLPEGHWLMTSRFDMEGFIPAVVMEEERQHQVQEEDEDNPGEEQDDNESAYFSRTGLIGMSRPRQALRIESLRKQQQKAARKRLLAAVGPRLEVLQNMPYVIPFETRVQIFRQFINLDQTRRRGGNTDPDIWRMSMLQNRDFNNPNLARDVLGRHHARIRRDFIFEDAYKQFYELGDGLKEPIQITFVDQFDTTEAGIDGGGVTKEFLTSITNETFKNRDMMNLFIANDQNLLYPNPAALDERRETLHQAGVMESTLEWKDSMMDLLRRYEFAGRVIGKCMYEGILVDIGFAGFFLLKWATVTGGELGNRANINDLRDLDESLYQGLLKLKNYPGNVEDFSLDFTITDEVRVPGGPAKTITRELVQNGSNMMVTNKNRPLYMSYVARHRLQIQPRQQTAAFLRGLGQIIKPSWLSMFNQIELQTLLGGEASEIDVADLRRNTIYGGVYQIGDDGLEHPTIQVFWQVMKELNDEDRRKVLRYVTSTPRAPLLGFSQLNPRFSIRDAGSDETRLPSTSTCVNLLKLPRYSTATILREKVLYAVNANAGFDLS